MKKLLIALMITGLLVSVDAFAAIKTTECLVGQYLKGTGKNKTCQPCGAGYYCPDGKKRQKCPAGTYAGSGASSCQKCSGDTYSAAGATSCKACPKGKTSNANHTKCIVEKAQGSDGASSGSSGSFDYSAVAEMMVCGKPGYYYKKNKQIMECTKCSEGYYCPDGENRKKCPAGTYAGSGASSCQKCSGDTYSSAGAKSCKACPKGKKASPDHTKCVKA